MEAKIDNIEFSFLGMSDHGSIQDENSLFCLESNTYQEQRSDIVFQGCAIKGHSSGSTYLDFSSYYNSGDSVRLSYDWSTDENGIVKNGSSVFKDYHKNKELIEFEGIEAVEFDSNTGVFQLLPDHLYKVIRLTVNGVDKVVLLCEENEGIQLFNLIDNVLLQVHNTTQDELWASHASIPYSFLNQWGYIKAGIHIPYCSLTSTIPGTKKKGKVRQRLKVVENPCFVSNNTWYFEIEVVSAPSIVHVNGIDRTTEFSIANTSGDRYQIIPTRPFEDNFKVYNVTIELSNGTDHYFHFSSRYQTVYSKDGSIRLTIHNFIDSIIGSQDVYPHPFLNGYSIGKALNGSGGDRFTILSAPSASQLIEARKYFDYNDSTYLYQGGFQTLSDLSDLSLTPNGYGQGWQKVDGEDRLVSYRDYSNPNVPVINSSSEIYFTAEFKSADVNLSFYLKAGRLTSIQWRDSRDAVDFDTALTALLGISAKTVIPTTGEFFNVLNDGVPTASTSFPNGSTTNYIQTLLSAHSVSNSVTTSDIVELFDLYFPEGGVSKLLESMYLAGKHNSTRTTYTYALTRVYSGALNVEEGKPDLLQTISINTTNYLASASLSNEGGSMFFQNYNRTFKSYHQMRINSQKSGVFWIEWTDIKVDASEDNFDASLSPDIKGFERTRLANKSGLYSGYKFRFCDCPLIHSFGIDPSKNYSIEELKNGSVPGVFIRQEDENYFSSLFGSKEQDPELINTINLLI